MKKIVTILAFSFITLLLTGGIALAAMTSGDGYQIWADVISVGGIEQATSSGGFYLDDTLGEAVTGRSSTTNNTMGAGFQEMIKDDILSLSVNLTSLNLGTLSTASTASSSHILYIECSAASGVDVSFDGATLTSGSYTIPAIGSTAANADPGTSQFGFNAIRTVGSVSNPEPPYDTAGEYAFNSGDSIISASAPMGSEEQYTVTYIADIGTSQAGGIYTSAITYTALANF